MINKLLPQFILLCVYISFASAAQAISLQKGQLVNEATVTELAATSETYNSILTALNTTSVADESSLKSFLQPGGTNGVSYALLGDKTLHKTTHPSDQYLGGWPLERWAHQYASPDVVARYQELSTSYPLPFDYETVDTGIGCYGESPLRFGDIENDTKKELVVILGNLFLIYSLEQKHIVFAEHLDASDWFSDAEKLDFYGANVTTNSQYVSRLLSQNNLTEPGIRAYAKLYFGDFNNDGQSDILAWRKTYRSNAIDNQLKGFSKTTDNLQHFSISNTNNVKGEYLPQVTDEITIRGWLSANALSWQKGYPGETECSGQLGLIPEMHDALLNDPEVMQ